VLVLVLVLGALQARHRRRVSVQLAVIPVTVDNVDGTPGAKPVATRVIRPVVPVRDVSHRLHGLGFRHSRYDGHAVYGCLVGRNRGSSHTQPRREKYHRGTRGESDDDQSGPAPI